MSDPLATRFRATLSMTCAVVRRHELSLDGQVKEKEPDDDERSDEELAAPLGR